MGTGRTLRKESHVRPCKTPAGKARRANAQRQRPTVVKKMVAKKAAAK